MTKLDNGLRIITDEVASVGSVALGVWVGVGTRNEDMTYNGAAHMVEHMLFKGTARRGASSIAEEIENVGGSMNAYTSREVTSYHMHLLAEHVPVALDVLADMMQNSNMPESEIERERHVILQEIGMCYDTPDDLVFDNYYEIAYPGQALGAPILGRAEIISNMRRDTLMEYVQRLYTPDNLVISAAGAIKHEDFVTQVKAQFNNLPANSAQPKVPANYNGGEHRTQKELEQSHIILGFQGVPRVSEEYYSAQALSAILGGGMSSRLFQEIREKRGLVYSVFSFHSAYMDDGQFGIYAGTGPKDLPELIPVMCEEVQKICSDLTEAEVERSRMQMKSSIIMGRESMMSRADQQAKYLLFRDKVLDIGQLTTHIESLNKDKIKAVAQKIFSSAPTLAALGPLQKLENFDAIKSRLSQKMAA